MSLQKLFQVNWYNNSYIHTRSDNSYKILAHSKHKIIVISPMASNSLSHYRHLPYVHCNNNSVAA